MSLIANYYKTISRELDYNVVPQTPLRELELVQEMRWLRTMLREAKVRLDGVEDLELEAFDLRDKNGLLEGQVERLERELIVVCEDRDKAEEELAKIKEVFKH